MQTLTHVPLPFSHTFGLNTTFCHCNAASCAVQWLSCSATNIHARVRFAVGLCMCDAGIGKEMHEAFFFLLQNLALQLGLGQGCQPEGIAITKQQLFTLRKRRTVTLECGSLRKFCTTITPRICTLWNGSVLFEMMSLSNNKK